MKPSQEGIAAENINAADRALAEAHAQEEFLEINPQDAADVADDVRGREREETPADDDRQPVALQQGLQPGDSARMPSIQNLLKLQPLREKINARGRQENAYQRENKQRDGREERNAYEHKRCGWNEREPTQAAEQEIDESSRQHRG
jgi:hypothetical protein